MRRGLAQFTLLELIIVMMLLAVLLAVAAPRLSGFVRGRSIQAESHRFLALTRLASNEAASRAETMELWIDLETNEYGLQVLADFDGDGHTPRSYTLNDGLRIQTNSSDPLVSILFMPNGLIDLGELKGVRIYNHRREEECVALVLNNAGSRFIVEETAE